MDRLPQDPRNFREIVEADLWRAARLVLKVQSEIKSQFHIVTPTGDWRLAVPVPLPGDNRERTQMLRRIATFMAWKQAVRLVMVCELTEPDCVVAVGVSHKELHVCISPIRRVPRPWTAASFGAVEWLSHDQIGLDITGLLPKGNRMITTTEITMLDKWFGAHGTFPAIHIASEEVREL
jgi:hypothetical protein